MDRLEAMSTFLAVVEHGSLSAASRRLKTPLATVSRKISELESHLRTQLFNRSSRKLVLTDAGSSYVEACKRILADVTEAERAAAGEYAAPTGELVVTAPVVFGRVCLIPILVDFLKAYPDIDVSLVLNDRVLSLFQEEIDVGLRIGALSDSSMVAIRVGAFHRVVCASPTYLAARGTPRTPEDLAGHDCTSATGLVSVSSDVWTFVRDKTNVAVPVHARLVVGSTEAACDAARAGIGIASVGSHLVRTALECGALKALPAPVSPSAGLPAPASPWEPFIDVQRLAVHLARTPNIKTGYLFVDACQEVVYDIVLGQIDPSTAPGNGIDFFFPYSLTPSNKVMLLVPVPMGTLAYDDGLGGGGRFTQVLVDALDGAAGRNYSGRGDWGVMIDNLPKAMQTLYELKEWPSDGFHPTPVRTFIAAQPLVKYAAPPLVPFRIKLKPAYAISGATRVWLRDAANNDLLEHKSKSEIWTDSVKARLGLCYINAEFGQRSPYAQAQATGVDLSEMRVDPPLEHKVQP